MECGVWRGGMTIFMRALLRAYSNDDTSNRRRRVIVSDSFQGMPDAVATTRHNVTERIRQIEATQWGDQRIVELAADNSGRMVEKRALTVEQNLVADNVRRFRLYSDDDRVVWVPGWFYETLPTAAADYNIQKLALLRIDGDMHSSTVDVLVHMYPLVSSGGFVILDDYNIEQSRLAVHDFFAKEGLDVNLIRRDRVTGPRQVTRDDHQPSHLDNEEFGAYFQTLKQASDYTRARDELASYVQNSKTGQQRSQSSRFWKISVTFKVFWKESSSSSSDATGESTSTLQKAGNNTAIFSDFQKLNTRHSFRDNVKGNWFHFRSMLP